MQSAFVCQAKVVECCVDDKGPYWYACATVRWRGDGMREVVLLVEPERYGLVAKCPELRKGETIRCALGGRGRGLFARTWVREADAPLKSATKVRIWRNVKEWNRKERCWVSASVNQFEGTLWDLCKQHPPNLSAFVPFDSQTLRCEYKFELLTTNHGWQQTADPRSRLEKEDVWNQ